MAKQIHTLGASLTIGVETVSQSCHSAYKPETGHLNTWVISVRDAYPSAYTSRCFSKGRNPWLTGLHLPRGSQHSSWLITLLLLHSVQCPDPGPPAHPVASAGAKSIGDSGCTGVLDAGSGCTIDAVDLLGDHNTSETPIHVQHPLLHQYPHPSHLLHP